MSHSWDVNLNDGVPWNDELPLLFLYESERISENMGTISCFHMLPSAMSLETYLLIMTVLC